MKKLISLFLFVCFVLALKAQVGDISGKVKDQNDWGIKATVAIVDTAGKPAGMAVQTDNDGNYSISPLKPGKYNLLFRAKGYHTVMDAGIIVSADKSTFIDVKLKVDPNAPVGKKKKK